jgi:hypothetical protein
MQDGETVAALDTDQQASLAGWGQRREANGLDIQRVEPSAFAALVVPSEQAARFACPSKTYPLRRNCF